MDKSVGGTSKSLGKNVGGYYAAIFQSVSMIAPAAVVASFIPEEAGMVGYSVPFVFLIAALGVLSAMYMNFSFSKRISHAGGYYGFVDAGLGRRASTFAGWLYFADLFGGVVAFPGLLFAATYWPLIPGLSNLSFGWVPLALVPIVITFVVEYVGIKPSLYYTFIGGVIEVSVIIAISIGIVIGVGSGNSFLPFTISPGSSGSLGLSTLYAILGFVGLGSVITLSEEIRAPKKVIGRSILLAFLIAFVTYMLISYALVVGWGVNNVAAAASQSDSVFTVIGHYLGPDVRLLLVLVTVNSFVSYTIANGNAALRLGYALARDNVIFKQNMSVVHTKSGTPRRFLYFSFGLMIVFTIIAGAAFGPLNAGLLISVEGGISLYIAHILANFSLPVYGWKKLKMSASKLWPLAVLPLPATGVYLYALYGSFIPFPGYPFNLGDLLAVVLIVIGLIFALTVATKKPTEESHEHAELGSK